MRWAELASLQKSLASRNSAAAASIDSFEFSKLSGVADASLEPTSGFISICGGTGTGKTAVLETIYYSLSSDDDPLPPSMDRISGTSFAASASYLNNVYQRSGTVDDIAERGEGYPPGVRLVTLDVRTSFIQRSFLDNDVEVLKEGVSSTQLDSPTVNALSLVCRKSYNSILYYEVEVEDGIYVPYFEIDESGLIYDSRSMSTGELSAFYLAWSCLVANAYGFLLVEEPEAYLPPQSHRAIIGLLAKFALAKRLAVVVTSHSVSIVSEVPDSGIISLRRDGAISTIIAAGEDRQRALKRLGLSPETRAIVLVEDSMAGAMLSEIISHAQMADYTRFEILIEPDGASAIIKNLEKFTANASSVRLFGALDGDQRSNRDKAKLKYPAILLPFEKQMETEILTTILSNIELFGEKSGRTADSIRDALSMSAGQDDHDRFRAVVAHLGMNEQQAVRISIDIWKDGRSEHYTSIERFVAELTELLK